MSLNRRLICNAMVTVLFISLSLLCVDSEMVQAANSNAPASRQTLLSELKSMGGKVKFDRLRGVAKFVNASRHAPLLVPGISPGAPPPFNAMVITEKLAGLFGLANPREELTVHRAGRNAAGGGMVNYRQQYQGVPVLAGELIVNMDRGGALLSMNGAIASIPKNLSVMPRLDKVKATTVALGAVAKWYKLPASALLASTPELTIYDGSLFGSGPGSPVRLVWRLEVRPRKLAPIRELILVDAISGGIALHFNQVDTIKDRQTYSANNSANLPGTLKCNESAGDACTNGFDKEADFAHLYAGKTYDFYQSYHNRDSFDGAGHTIISSVNFNDGVTCPNAYWDGTQMVYCQGLPEADDVVAHELTHAVTERTSNLFYYYQSGAINESLSDLWGEFVDQTDGYGNDTASVKWLLGEDLKAPGMTGAIRDMKNPPAYQQPDRMSSSRYYFGTDDGGGVHTNSGINNKAVYLMTDGDTFNGQTVSGLGIPKVAKIYYEAQTNLLTSGADYRDLDNALNQACANLIGTDGVTANDCDQVLAATAAVEMDQDPAGDYNPEAPVCPSGQAVNDAFFDDFENGLGKWSLTSPVGTQDWAGFHARYGYSFATSGVESLFGGDVAVKSDQQATMTVTVPAGQPYLHFRHAFEFEQSGANYYDGGVLEYSTDSGSTWSNALPSYFDSGKNYNGTMVSGGDNPLAGYSGFVGGSHGYVSTRLNLAALAGQNVKFRWRVGTDADGKAFGWFLDDVRVYTCGGNLAPTANAGAPQVVTKGSLINLNGSGSSDSDGTIASYAWIQTGGYPSVTLVNSHTATPSFAAPASVATLTFRLTVTDNQGASATATTKVTTVNTAPVAEAGPVQTVNAGAVVTLSSIGSSDSDGAIVSYAWTQTGGTSVTINNANTATSSFTAPSGATTLTFRLTVTDNDGATGTDTTAIAVIAAVNALPVAEAGPPQTANTGAVVTLNGTASSDSDGTLVSYAWTQIGGTTVTINNANTPNPSFTSPSSATALTFRLTVTDNAGATSTDTTTVTVKAPVVVVPVADSGGGGGGGCSLSRDGASDPLLALVFLGCVAVIWRRRNN